MQRKAEEVKAMIEAQQLRDLRAIRSASDLTNELLKANAENLKQGNTEARREIEREAGATVR